MAGNDPLDGFRGIRPEEVRAAYQRAAQQDDPRQTLARRYLLGIQTEKAMLGIASISEAQAVCASVIDGCEAQAMGAMRELLACDDLSSPEARVAHYRARVAAGMLTLLNDFVTAGNSAAQQLAEEQTDGD